ncbi:hypothetical protein EC988_008694, partial [Linderina pennispora]
MQQGHATQIASTKLAFEQQLYQVSEDLQDAEEEVAELRYDLDLKHQESQRLFHELNAKQQSIDELVNDQQALQRRLAEMQSSFAKSQADCNEWKQECIKTREALDSSERVGIETRQQILQMTEAQQEMQRMFDGKQRAWEDRAQGMTENIGKLKTTLDESIRRVRELEAAMEKERAENAELLRKTEAMEQKLAG